MPPKTRTSYSNRVHHIKQKFHSKIHMKQVFLQGLAASWLRYNRLYVVVLPSIVHLDKRNALNSDVTGHTLTSSIPQIQNQSPHKLTMCYSKNMNDECYKFVVTNDRSDLNPCHKRSVGQMHSYVSLGQILPTHNRFVVLQDDTQTQYLGSTSESFVESECITNSQL